MRPTSVMRRFSRWLQPGQVAVFEACLIGLVSALAAGWMAQGVDWLGGLRVALANQWSPWLVLPAVGFVGALLSGWLIQAEAPEASGSGMSQVKAVLARVPLPLNLRTALVKLISAVLALGSGLALGREGPTVQVGSALASQLSHWLPTSPEHRRQLIAAGAGAGLAAAFNAPIAGVLFVAEELMQDVSGGTLGTAILASFIGSSVSRLLGGNSLDVNLDALKVPTGFTVQEIPLCIVLGLLAGALGALFNQGILAGLKLNRRYIRVNLPWRMALAGVVSGLIVALLPSFFQNVAGLKELLLSGQAHWHQAAIAFVIQFALIIIAYGSGAPGGLLVPTLILGASLGSCLGSLQADFLGLGLPTTFARVGMGAFMAGTSKAPITSIVMVFEITRDFNLVLPLMIVSVSAYLVSERLFPGSFYDKMLELNGIYLEAAPTTDGRLAGLSAAQVMQSQVETLNSNMSLDQVILAFSQSHHRGFPILEGNKLVGIVTQSDLQAMTQRQLPGDSPVSAIMTAWLVTVKPTDSLTDVLYLLNRYRLSRLPVLEGRKLVGIITRSDIIRVEASELGGDRGQFRSRSNSYLVYQTRAPATGRGRLLVPLANPETVDVLLELAVAIARHQELEVECLQVILVPRHSDPARTPVRTTASCRLLKQAERIGKAAGVPVHTQARAAQDVAQAILDTLKERHIDRLLMGWEGKTSTSGRIFGNVVDTIIHQAECEVLLVKLAQFEDKPQFDRWLVPIAGGPNAQRAIQLLPALTAISPSPQIRLCQVFNPGQSAPDTAVLNQDLDQLKQTFADAVSSVSLRSKSVAEAVINLADSEQDDVIVLGASRESLLQHAIKGNIPEAIARHSKCTVILVRGAISAHPSV
ncbi:MAG: chloride channel protein [Aphanocapsa sp. GSE-SYN-MK-11-07L]|nr:chloride channel protein [Aphanocapsa sp. GSE-SYN-MK-11-07L]